MQFIKSVFMYFYIDQNLKMKKSLNTQLKISNV